MASIAYSRHTADAQVTTHPTLLHGIFVLSTSTAETSYIKNGGSGGDVVFTLYMPAVGYFSVTFPVPVAIPNGIYLDVGSNDQITLFYE
ncbi:MAG: hypothetical protein JW726_15085 [Anaerolineales bacterium]|nr:hypothetical protein [Anaerolineales bacterium]